MARRPGDIEGVQSHLDSLARIFGENSLEVAMTEGAKLLAEVASCRHAVVFLADGNEPLREFWHSEAPEDRERIRATFKSAALEAAQSGAPVTPHRVDLGDRSIQGHARPLVTSGRVLGALCLSDMPPADSQSAGRDRMVNTVAGLLAYKAALHEEIARYHIQRERDQRWFKTLDGHLRVLDRERQKFAAFVNQTDTFVFVTDDSRTIRWNNRAMSDLYPADLAQTNWEGKSCSDVCSRLRKECEDCPVAAAQEHARVVHQELRAEVRGTAGLLYLTALPILGPSGRADEIMVMIQDLTGLEGLRKSEERLRTVIGGAPIVLFALDPNGVFTFSEGRGLAALGRASGDSVGKSVYDLYADHPEICEYVRRALRGEEVSAEVDLGHAAYEARYAPLRDGQGKIQGVIGVATDITSRIEAQRALQESEAALRESEKQLRHAQKMEAIGVLAGGVAHDFNNLLTVILNQAGQLMKSLPAGSPGAAKTAEIQAASARGALLTRQLLAFSRKEIVSPQILDLNALISELGGMLRGIIHEDVDLVCSLTPDRAMIRADRGQVEQVLMNFVSNSRDAMPKGGKLKIEVARVVMDGAIARELDTAGPGLYCALSVEDTGSGIDGETLERIFEPFFTTKEQGKGTGLGLSTAYGIMKQGGGSIGVTSELGKGAKFTAYFPSVAEEMAPVAASAARNADPPALSRVTETVLLVEDEPGVRAIGREVLEMNGYKVLEAENGAQGLEVAEAYDGPIHILLSDIVMPVMSGRELAERLSVQRPEMRVLFISGFTDDAMVRDSVSAQRVAFLQKPFSIEVLTQKIREILDGKAPLPATRRRP